MRTLLLETNAINKAYSNHISGTELKNIFNRLKLIPIVNQHTTYELYRIYRDEKKLIIGKELFAILNDLDPVYTCQTKALLRREIDKLRLGKSVDYFIEPGLGSSLKKAILEAANGKINQISLSFIENREEEIELFLKI